MKPARKPPNWRHSRTDFERWLKANGAEPLGAKQHEFMRFRAHGILCIAYERNKKGGQSFVPDLARAAFEAWHARGSLDLSNPIDDPAVENWHAMGRALMAVGERAKAGPIDIAAEAAVLGIPPDRLARSLVAQGARTPRSSTI